MKVICKHYNEQTGYYEGIAIVAEEGESKGSEENPFTGEDVGKAMRDLEGMGLIKDGVAAIYIGRSEDDVPVIFEEQKEELKLYI